MPAQKQLHVAAAEAWQARDKSPTGSNGISSANQAPAQEKEVAVLEIDEAAEDRPTAAEALTVDKKIPAPASQVEQLVPPPNGGFEAWITVVACCFIFMNSWSAAPVSQKGWAADYCEGA